MLEELALIFKGFCCFQTLFPFAFFFISSVRYALINATFLFAMAYFGFYSLVDVLNYYPTLSYMWSELSSLQNSIDASLNFAITPLSFFFTLLVLLIGGATNIYTIRYFSDEASEKKFLFTLNFFVISMIILVNANNFYTIFLGWELIGLTSFFLINFWSVRRGTLKSSFKAFSFNLVSDIFILTAFILFYNVTSCTQLDPFFAYIYSHSLSDNSQLYYGLICLIVGSAFKSVQIFGHLWLPDSMEAPVPASALIHSATLVSAGIYLLCRFHFLITIFHLVNILATIGAFTAAYGGIVAASQTDVKKLLAYSTMSHSGFLWFLAAIGQGYPIIIYLYLHGLFKAMTFFCAGSFIRIFGTQDARMMGEGHINSKLDSFFLILCAGNLAGLPFTIGFINKYFFINMFFSHPINYFTFGLLFIALLCSIIYFVRLVFFVVFDYNKTIKDVNHQLLVVSETLYTKKYNKTPFTYTISIIILYWCSWVMSYYFVTCAEVVMFWAPFITPFDSDYYKYIKFFAQYEYYLLCLYEFYALTLVLIFVFCWKRRLFLVEGICILLIFFYCTLFINMWGHIMTEANSLTNFNFGFSTHKSDILIHLSQWQYWWWFWFSLFWVMYFFIIIRVVHKRVSQFNPILNTSIRGHGKWGDFLVALIPLSWCGNILVNSNFILRMIEWQNEGSLFTLRIIGRQWYWEYRYDSTALASIMSAPKNIGHNRWFFIYANESYCSDSYYQALTLGMQLEFKNLFYKTLVREGISKNAVSTVLGKGISIQNYPLNLSSNQNVNFDNINTESTPLEEPITTFYNCNSIDMHNNYESNVVLGIKKKPLSFVAGVLNKHNLEILKNSTDSFNKPVMFVLKFWDNSKSIEPKIEMSHLFWGFKQKKYTRYNSVDIKPRKYYNPGFFKEVDTSLEKVNNTKDLLELNELNLLNPLILKSDMTIKSPQVDRSSKEILFVSPEQTVNMALKYHITVKNNRHRSELVPVNLARRLLRTKRTLVLPAHVNITVITNSCDVVHSWFIPGLGLKLDCVPGRSTHHTFYIDNIGFYYGQCAEICGRYHHHMPIKLCALPFEQFLVWWKHKGLKRFHRLKLLKSKQHDTNNIAFRYKW